MNLSKIDQAHIWHPLTQYKHKKQALAISKAKGALLYDTDGNSYIDGIASWYTCTYGHSNSYITERVSKQLTSLDHVVFAGFTHEPAIRLSEELIKVLPDNQQKIFFSDNGSTAVEVGLKMAIQYHANQGRKKQTIIALENGFHGDTFGAMSVSGLSVYNGPFEDLFISVKRIPVPTADNIDAVLKQLQALLDTEDIAAFVYEPLVQGAAGMKIYEAQYLNQLLALTQSHQVLNIADEVMTGFGKLGVHFASHLIDTQPDIICLAKSLTGGIGPMAITTCTQKIFDAFIDDSVAKGLFHAHTYSANPILCAAALAALELLQSDEMQQNIERIAAKHQAYAQQISQHPKVRSVSCKGVILSIELALDIDRYGNIRDRLFNFFMEQGVYLRPLGNTVYTLPPFITSDEQLDRIYSSISLALEQF